MTNKKTYNPIIGESEYKNDLFIKIPIPAAGEAILLSGETGILEINSLNSTKVTTRQIRTGKYHKQIRFDIRSHQIEFSFSAVSANNINRFNFIVSAVCKVEEPLTVYEYGITDACSVVKTAFENQLRDIASSYMPSDIADLRSTLSIPFADKSTIYSGIYVSDIVINVEFDDAYRTHLEKLGKIDNEAEIKSKELHTAKIFAQSGIDDTTAVFSAVLAGRITLEEAATKLKSLNNSDFDENIRRLNTVKDIFFDLVEKGILTEEQAAKQMSLQITSVASTPNKTQPTLMLEQSEQNKNDDIYQVIDD